MTFGTKYFEYTEDGMRLLFLRMHPRLSLYINGVLSSRESCPAEDVIQDIFYKLLRQQPHLERSKIEAYVFSMAHNECIDYLRRDRIFLNSITVDSLVESSRDWEELVVHDFLDAPPSPLAGLLVEEVLTFCNQLPEQTARVFRMSRIEGMTNAQIAEQLGIAQRTVEKHITLSIKRFREVLPSHND